MSVLSPRKQARANPVYNTEPTDKKFTVHCTNQQKAQGLISVSIGKVIFIYRLRSTWPKSSTGSDKISRMIYSLTKKLSKNNFNGVKNYYGSSFSQIIKKLPKTSCVLTIAVYLVRSTICLLVGMVRINFFDWTCLQFDGYKYFVEHVNCSSHRSKKSKVSNEHRFITFSWAVQTAPIIRSKHFSSRSNGTVYSVRYRLNERAYVSF